MDTKTEDQKMYDTALASERRTIGHRMSRKVIVVAPFHIEAAKWASTHGIIPADLLYVGPTSVFDAFRGQRGVEHVILGWARLDPETRERVKELLWLIESVPFEETDDAELLGAAPVRD